MWANHPIPPDLATLPVLSSLAGWALLLLATAWSLRASQAEVESTRSRWAWGALLAGVLVTFRWPLIALPHELYPDESQLLAGARTLLHDPLFWRSVDGGTAGPLDYFALLPAAIFPLATGYAVTRLTAALIICGMLVAAGEAIALVANRRVARLAVLPALAFEALTTSPEFIHYSTELVPGLLIALAVLFIVRHTVRPAGRNLWTAGLLLGAIPYSKLQAAPIAAALGLLLLIHEIMSGRGKNTGLLIGVALLPTLLLTTLLTLMGQVEHMLIPYFLQNTLYAQTGRQTLTDVVRQFGEQSFTNGYHALWFAGCAAFCAGGMFFVRRAPSSLRHWGRAAAGLLAVTLFCILSPGRPYHHYLNLLTLPVTLLTGIVLGLALPARPALVSAVFLFCTLLPALALRASPWPDPFEYYNTTVSARGPDYRRLVAVIRSLSSPGEALGVWGWRSSLYVETGLHQATRLAHTEALLVAGPWQKYYLRRYYDDLLAAAPPVFVDATGPGNFRFDHRALGHEMYPLLHEWVRTHYAYAGERDGVRIYVRLDRRPVDRPFDQPR